METSTPSDSTLVKLADNPAKARLQALKDLFAGEDWQLLQEELAQVRADLVERVVATKSSGEAEQLRGEIRGLDRLRDPNFKVRALQNAGQQFDKPSEAQHYMALDSADQRLLTTKENPGSAH